MFTVAKKLDVEVGIQSALVLTRFHHAHRLWRMVEVKAHRRSVKFFHPDPGKPHISLLCLMALSW